MEKIDESRAAFSSIIEVIDTTTPAGPMLTQTLGGFAEFQGAMIRGRTRAGLATARFQGRWGGRPPKLFENHRTEAIRMMRSDKKTSVDVARLFDVNRSAISRLLAVAWHNPLSAIERSARKQRR